jgi:hypothetical protein
LLAILSVPTQAQTPLGTPFAYQDQLKPCGQPFNGNANLVFRLTRPTAHRSDQAG